MPLLRYKKIGSGGEHVIVLAGLPSHFSLYGPTLHCLNVDTFTYVFPDYRGFGESLDMQGTYTLSEIVNDVLRLVDHLGWCNFHVVGHSFGGMVAQRLMVDHATRLKTVVALSPVPACGLKADAQTNDFLLSTADSYDNCMSAIDSLTGQRLSEHWRAWLVRVMRQVMVRDAYISYLRVMMESDFSENMLGLTTPCLVTIGELDEWYTANLMQKSVLAWLPNAELEVIHNCGHYPMQEAPVYLVSLMERFMSSYPGMTKRFRAQAG